MTATYPSIPGFKVSVPETSKLAAFKEAGRMLTLRDRCFSVLQRRSMTADEVAEELGETVLATRPRLSELRALGKIDATTRRRCNISGHTACVWQVVAQQGEMFK